MARVDSADMRSRRQVRWWQRRGSVRRLAGCFLAVSAATVFIRFAPEANHLIWIANGVLLAFLLLAPRRFWPGYLCVGFVAQAAGSILVNSHWEQNSIFNALNIAEVLISAFLMRLWSPGLPRFTDRAYLIRFVGFCVVAGPVIVGSIYGMIAAYWYPFPRTGLLQWAVADGLGAAVAAPACVAVFRMRFKSPAGLGKHWVYLLLLGVVSLVAFSQNTISVLFLVFPLLALVLLRLGLGLAAMATLFVAGIGSWFTLHGEGPFGFRTSHGVLDPAIGLQVFIASAMFMLYTVSVVLESQHATERRLQKIVARHSLVTENSRDIIILADFDGNRSYASAEAERMLGWDAEELAFHKSLDLLHPEDRPKAAAKVQELSAGCEGAILECRVRRRSGDYIWVEANLRVVRDPKSGKPCGLLNIVRDISERKRAEQLREFHLSLLAAIHEVSLDGILVVNEENKVVSYNNRFSDVWKISAPEIPSSLLERDIELSDEQLLSQVLGRTRYPEQFLKRVQELYANPEAHDHCQIELVDGRTVERHSSGLHTDRGKYLGRVWFFRDITERKRAEQQLQDAFHTVEALAVTDALTGLANRRQFDQCLSNEWRRSLRDRGPLSMLLLDVDLFKSYNDAYGHVQGDCCLKQIADAAMQVVARPGDTVARIGGEEFAVILPNTDNDGAIQLAEEICEAVRRRDLLHSANPHGVVTISAGCATILPSLGRHSITLIELADMALYQAKRSGRNRVCNGTSACCKDDESLSDGIQNDAIFRIA